MGAAAATRPRRGPPVSATHGAPFWAVRGQWGPQVYRRRGDVPSPGRDAARAVRAGCRCPTRARFVLVLFGFDRVRFLNATGLFDSARAVFGFVLQKRNGGATQRRSNGGKGRRVRKARGQNARVLHVGGPSVVITSWEVTNWVGENETAGCNCLSGRDLRRCIFSMARIGDGRWSYAPRVARPITDDRLRNPGRNARAGAVVIHLNRKLTR
jgi:hypothetical protein